MEKGGHLNTFPDMFKAVSSRKSTTAVFVANVNRLKSTLSRSSHYSCKYTERKVTRWRNGSPGAGLPGATRTKSISWSFADADRKKERL